MATLKLFDPAPADSDHSHHVTAPGGYEVWQFHFFDPERGIRAVIAFHDGLALHPGYIDHYLAYRRWPTHRSPPTPALYPCLTVSLSAGGKPLVHSILQFPAHSFQASAGIIALQDNHVTFAGNRIDLQFATPSFSATLSLETPGPAPIIHKQFAVPAGTCSKHHWLFARPLATATGKIQIAGQTVTLSGIGQHNHYFGASSLVTANHWLNGAVLLPDRAINFSIADGHCMLLCAEPGGTSDEPNPQWTGLWDRTTPWLLRYPSSLDIAQSLQLRNPRLMDASSAQIELLYDAYIDGEQASAFVEIAYPSRLRHFIPNWRASRRIQRTGVEIHR